MSDEDKPGVEMNTKELDALIKALKGKLPMGRVGVLGQKGVRANPKAGPSNAEVGASHEFGTDKLPIRSFLRVPISDNLQKYLENSGAFDKEALKKVVSTATVVEWLKKVCVVAEAIVADAFNSGGFGKWTPSDMTHKKNHQTLVETQQLRNSITSEVKE